MAFKNNIGNRSPEKQIFSIIIKVWKCEDIEFLRFWIYIAFSLLTKKHLFFTQGAPISQCIPPADLNIFDPHLDSFKLKFKID